ncbi:MAG: hypothetical protein IKB10_00785 [Alphaproteobacteria bacterium]|nr:hypothetical protein [Alphaproteobacteria bacterium]
MNKFLKLTGVSILAVVATTNANAAGYTCEELIEYTSCNAGYYLTLAANGTAMVCPDGYPTMLTNGICIEHYQETILTSVTSEEDCYYEDPNGENAAEWTPGIFCVGAVDEFGVEANDYTTLVEGSTYGYTCIQCPAGSTCAGNTAGATLCPAGSYCATAGLSQPTGKCNVGTYSTGGATACTSCPASGLTDANGNVVSVTTESTGSTSSSACFVAKGTLFKDNKGIYKYTDNCEYGNFDRLGDAFYESDNGSCMNGYEYKEAYEGENGRNGMVISVTGCYKIPDTEEWCDEVEGSWIGDSCECDMEWFGDSTGIYLCTNS